jgi:hypothetical protein
MRTCDGIFSANCAAAWLQQQAVAGRECVSRAEARPTLNPNGICSMTGSLAALAKKISSRAKVQRSPA